MPYPLDVTPHEGNHIDYKIYPERAADTRNIRDGIASFEWICAVDRQQPNNIECVSRLTIVNTEVHVHVILDLLQIRYRKSVNTQSENTIKTTATKILSRRLRIVIEQHV